MMTIGNWCNKLKIVEDHINNTVIDRLFISANFQQPENPKFFVIGKCLVRFEFWELLVRIASNKYMVKDAPYTYSQSLEKLIEEKLRPYDHEPWQAFRDKHLWTIEVNDILEANLKNLEKIY